MSLGKVLAFCFSNKDKLEGITVVVQEREEKRRESEELRPVNCLRRFLWRERETAEEIAIEEILCWTSKFEEKFKYNYKLPFDSISFAFHLPADPSNQQQEQPVED